MSIRNTTPTSQLPKIAVYFSPEHGRQIHIHTHNETVSNNDPAVTVARQNTVCTKFVGKFLLVRSIDDFELLFKCKNHFMEWFRYFFTSRSQH